MFLALVYLVISRDEVGWGILMFLILVLFTCMFSEELNR